MKTILVATDVPFWLNSQGSERRVAALCDFLSRAGNKVVVFYARSVDGETTRMIRSAFPGIEVIGLRRPDESVSTMGRLLTRLRRFMYHRVDSWRRLSRIGSWGRILGSRRLEGANTSADNPALSGSESQWARANFRALVRRVRPDHVIVEYLRLAFLVRGIRQLLPRETKLLVDTHDVMHQRSERYLSVGEVSGLTIGVEEETEALRPFDAIMAIQGRDAEVFRSMLPESRVLTVGHSLRCYHHERVDRSEVAIGFVGGPDVANVRAIRNFLAQVWSSLRLDAAPKVSLRIYGRVCESLDVLTLPPGVEAMGFVVDEQQPFRECDIFINPVDIGGGLKIKNVEALCHGKPLVTTPLGAEGLEDGSGWAFLVCEESEETIAALTRLISNREERESLAEKAYEFALTRFSEEAAYGDLLAFLEASDSLTSP